MIQKNNARKAWLLSLFYVMFMVMEMNITAVIIEPLRSAFNIGLIEISWIAAAFFYPYTLAQLPIGFKLDQLGALRLMRYLFILSMLGSALFSLSENYLTAMLARFMIGIAVCGAIPCCLYLCIAAFDSKYFVFLVGIVEAAVTLTAAVFQPGAAFLLGWLQWYQLSWLLFAFSTLLCLGAWLLPEAGTRHQADWQRQEAALPSREIMRYIFSWQVVLNGVIAGFLFAFVMGFAGLWAIPYLERAYAVSHQVAALISGCLFLGAGIGAPIIGFYATTVVKQYKSLLVGSAVAIGGSVLIFANIMSIAAVAVLFFVVGFAVSIYVVPYGVAKNIVPKNVTGAVMSMVNLLTGAVGAMFFVPLIGFLVDGDSGPKWSLLSAQWLFVAGLAIQLFLLIFFKKTILAVCPVDFVEEQA